MSDRMGHRAEELKGKAKTAWGDATGDQTMADRGRGIQAKAKVKQMGDNLKKALRRSKNDAKR